MSADEMPPHEAPAGRAWVIRIQSDRWRLCRDLTKRCRWGAAPRKRACGRPAVVELDRALPSQRGNWWGYCEAHMYGRWIEDGHVVGWSLTEVEAS